MCQGRSSPPYLFQLLQWLDLPEVRQLKSKVQRLGVIFSNAGYQFKEFGDNGTCRIQDRIQSS
jgi:hypothetical protein